MNSHIPRKRFGQNFLQDDQIIARIVDAVNPQVGEIVVEIGPGLAALTRPLLQRLGHLHVVEIDRDIIGRLQKTFSLEQLTIHQGDALKFDFSTVGARIKIVGNLPYNISTPLLFHLASYGEQVIDMHFMLQKEVVERMVAKPGCADYGRLSVMLQYRFEMENILAVPPSAFLPPPKVESAVVRMIPAPGRCGVAKSESMLEKIVLQAFSQRRKTLRNNLKALLSDQDFENLQIDAAQRPERISVEQYVSIVNYLSR